MNAKNGRLGVLVVVLSAWLVNPPVSALAQSPSKRAPSKLQGVFREVNNLPSAQLPSVQGDSAAAPGGANLGAAQPARPGSPLSNVEVPPVNVKSGDTGSWAPSDSAPNVDPPRIDSVGDVASTGLGAAFGLHNMPEASRSDPVFPAQPQSDFGGLLPNFEGGGVPLGTLGIIGAGLFGGITPQTIIQLGITSGMLRPQPGKAQTDSEK